MENGKVGFYNIMGSIGMLIGEEIVLINISEYYKYLITEMIYNWYKLPGELLVFEYTWFGVNGNNRNY